MLASHLALRTWSTVLPGLNIDLISRVTAALERRHTRVDSIVAKDGQDSIRPTAREVRIGFVVHTTFNGSPFRACATSLEHKY